MPLPKFLTGLLTGKAPDLIKSVTDGLDSLLTSKEEKEILANKKLEIEILLQKEINSHAEKMEELAMQETKAYLEDNANARNREIQLATSSASWITRNTTATLALGFVGVTLLLYTLSIVKAVEIHQDILRDLRDIVILIMGYYFGSSLGSKQKQDSLDKIHK